MRPGHDPSVRGGGLGPGRIPDELIHAVLDGELDERSAGEILREVRRRPEQRRELVATSVALGALRSGVSSPDLTGKILAESHRRRRFLGPRVRAAVETARWGVAAAVLAVVGGLVTLRMSNPDALRLRETVRPIENVSVAVSDSVRAPVREVRAQVGQIRAAMVPAQAAGAGVRLVGTGLLGSGLEVAGRLMPLASGVDERDAFAGVDRVTSIESRGTLTPGVDFGLCRVLDEQGRVVVVAVPMGGRPVAWATLQGDGRVLRSETGRQWGGGWSSGGLMLVSIPTDGEPARADGSGVRGDGVVHASAAVRMGVRLVQPAAEFIVVSDGAGDGGAEAGKAGPLPRTPRW